MVQTTDFLIVGAGIFGVTAALELRRRGHDVTLVDPGPIPHPLAATTDISKVVRMEYAADEFYMGLVEESLPGWRHWNEELKQTLYHETGVLMITRSPMIPGGFEYESYHTLLRRGHWPERLDESGITHRFPAWQPGAYVDGFYHALGGFVESGRLLQALVESALKAGVRLAAGQAVSQIVIGNGRCQGVRLSDGEMLSSEHTIVAAGAWTPLLIPEMQKVMFATGHAVFHLQPPTPEHFTPPNFVVFTDDVARSGWYGFPLHPREGVVKIANHGPGQRLQPQGDERVVTASDEAALRSHLAESLPELADAPIVYKRLCLYCDTLDEHFWIDCHPEITGLSVAAGGSGHGFKFAPVLGGMIADAAEGLTNPRLERFRWRELVPETTGEEAARYHGGTAAQSSRR